MKVDAFYWIKLSNLLTRVEHMGKMLSRLSSSSDERDKEDFETRIAVLERNIADEMDRYMINAFNKKYYHRDRSK